MGKNSPMAKFATSQIHIFDLIYTSSVSKMQEHPMTSPRTGKPEKPKKNSYIHFLHLKLCRSIPPLWPIQLGWPNIAQMGIFQKEGERKWQKVSPKSDFLLFFFSRQLKSGQLCNFLEKLLFCQIAALLYYCVFTALFILESCVCEWF